MKYHVGIQFCGGCNPHINRMRVAERVCDRLIAKGYAVAWNCTDCDFIVFISGCAVSCAERQGCGKPSIRVAAATVDFTDVAEQEIAVNVVVKVASYFEQLEKSLS